MKIRRVAMDAVLGVFVTIVLFGSFELILWAADMGQTHGASVSRGFDSEDVMFWPDPQVEGAVIPHIFGGKQKERPIPPKSEAKRILLFGGSSTRGFQHGRLPEHLQELAGIGKYEVINLGRSGAGSVRVKIIFDQAIEMLQPDIVVLYTGHNELTEAAFAIELADTWSSDWMNAAGALANHSRTVQLLAQSFAPERTRSDSKDGAWESQYRKFTKISYDQTRRFFEQYDDNLRAMITSARDRGIGVLLSTVIYNRWVVPHSSNFPPDFSKEDRIAFRKLHRRALSKLPECITKLLLVEGRDQDRVHYFDWGKSEEGGLMGPEGEDWDPLPGLRPSYGPLKDQSPFWGTSDMWEPKVLEQFQAMANLHAHRGDTELRKSLSQARTMLLKCLKIGPNHPGVYWELALVEYLMGVGDRAVRRRFETAAKFDRAPRKSNEITNGILRKLARDFPEIAFIDSDKLFSERVPMGLVGWEWMTDHCHMNKGARIVLMRDFAEVIVDSFGK